MGSFSRGDYEPIDQQRYKTEAVSKNESALSAMLKGEVRELKDMMKTLISAVDLVKSDVKRVKVQNAKLKGQLNRSRLLKRR